MYPILLKLSGRLAVVIGGGSVGRRKAEALLAAGACVRLICLEPRPPELTAPHLEWRAEAYRADHLRDAQLVFAAATKSVNEQVRADARQLGVWANQADDPEGSDFLVPAALHRRGLVIAVGTGGAAPALGQAIRDHLAQQFDEAFGHWVEVLADLRPRVQVAIADRQARQALLSSWCRWEWLDRLRREGADAVRAAMQAELGALVKERAAPL